jgi:hypothetical protein
MPHGARVDAQTLSFHLCRMTRQSHHTSFTAINFIPQGTGPKQQLKQYANKVMDDYAKNFKKQNINGNRDLVYYGKVEQHR